jgi:hypothetical protein
MRANERTASKETLELATHYVFTMALSGEQYCLPDCLDLILGDDCVFGDDGDSFFEGLADEHSIEGVAVNRGQGAESFAVGKSYGAWDESCFADHHFEIAWCTKLAQRSFERHFPGGHDTDKDLVSLVDDCVACGN